MLNFSDCSVHVIIYHNKYTAVLGATSVLLTTLIMIASLCFQLSQDIQVYFYQLLTTECARPNASAYMW